MTVSKYVYINQKGIKQLTSKMGFGVLYRKKKSRGKFLTKIVFHFLFCLPQSILYGRVTEFNIFAITFNVSTTIKYNS